MSKITAPTYTEIDAKAKAMVRKLASKSFITQVSPSGQSMSSKTRRETLKNETEALPSSSIFKAAPSKEIRHASNPKRF